MEITREAPPPAPPPNVIITLTFQEAMDLRANLTGCYGIAERLRQMLWRELPANK